MADGACERIVRDLIRVCEDGERGFSGWAARVARPELKRFFEIRAGGCRDAAQALAALIGEPPGSHAGAGDAAAASASGGKLPPRADDELSVLQECEQAEDEALERYEQAMRADLPPLVREVVTSQYQGALRNHDQVRALRDRALADRDAGRV